MSIAILVVGTRGDVQPFLELGKKLLEKGHRVRLATHDVFRAYVMEAGLEFYPLGGDPKKLSEYMCKTGGRLLPNVLDKSERHVIPEKMEMLRTMMYATWPAVSAEDPGASPPVLFRADVVIANMQAYGNIHVAERLGVPVQLISAMPWSPTRAFPHPISILGRGCDKWHFQPSMMQRIARMRNFMSYFAVDEFVYTGMRRMINEFREDVLNIERIRAGEEGAWLVVNHKVPIAFQWSESMLPRPHDWGPHIDITGAIFSNEGSIAYQPPEDLKTWLDNGEKPIFVGFGSMMIDNPTNLAKMIVKAACSTKTRVILQSSWSTLSLGDSADPDRQSTHEDPLQKQLVYFLGNCPHDWLFKQVRAVVHHGGAGTAAAGLRAGCPTMICPFFGDQHLWAQALVKIGVAVNPVPVEQLTSDILADAFCP